MRLKLLTIENLKLEYGGLTAIENVNLTVSENEYICVVGSNGSGKSTLMKGILGLHKPSAGSIVRHIEDRRIAYLPQTSLAERDFPATVREVVSTGRQWTGNALSRYSKEDKEAIDEALEMLGMTDLQNRRIGRLSGGQQQRAYLARALCRKPKLLLLDEPCSGLDPQITAQFYELLEALCEKQKITIMMNSHDLNEVARCANRVLVINRTVEFDGSKCKWLEKYDPGCTLHTANCDESGVCGCIREGKK